MVEPRLSNPAYSQTSDGELMSQVQRGDIDAFEVLYDRYAGRALRIAFFYCRDRGRAEDAVQEGFLAIWRSRGTYRSELCSFGAWALKIIHHRAIDSTRREAIRPPVAETKKETEDEAAVSPPAEIAAREQGDALRAALKRLPPAQAEIITLAYFGELSHAEIAERLSLPPGTVKGRMRLGMRKLRRTLRMPA